MVGFQKMTGDLLEGSSTCFLHVTVFSARGSEVMGLVSRNLLCGMHSLPMDSHGRGLLLGRKGGCVWGIYFKGNLILIVVIIAIITIIAMYICIQ